MKKRPIEQYEFVFDVEEAKLLMHSLDYVGHRMREHGKTWVANLAAVETLRNEIRAALKV